MNMNLCSFPLKYFYAIASKVDAIERTGVSVGRKTTRARLLEMLEKHVKPKRPRLSRHSLPSRLTFKRQPVAKDEAGHTTKENADTNTKYSQFNKDQLIEMLRGVGLDTSGLWREDLLMNCRTYDELSEYYSKLI